jgi:hypothetical protein
MLHHLLQVAFIGAALAAPISPVPGTLHRHSSQHRRPVAWTRTSCGSPAVKPQADIITPWGAALPPDADAAAFAQTAGATAGGAGAGAGATLAVVVRSEACRGVSALAGAFPLANAELLKQAHLVRYCQVVVQYLMLQPVLISHLSGTLIHYQVKLAETQIRLLAMLIMERSQLYWLAVLIHSMVIIRPQQLQHLKKHLWFHSKLLIAK